MSKRIQNDPEMDARLHTPMHPCTTVRHGRAFRESDLDLDPLSLCRREEFKGGLHVHRPHPFAVFLLLLGLWAFNMGGAERIGGSIPVWLETSPGRCPESGGQGVVVDISWTGRGRCPLAVGRWPLGACSLSCQLSSHADPASHGPPRLSPGSDSDALAGSRSVSWPAVRKRQI